MIASPTVASPTVAVLRAALADDPTAIVLGALVAILAIVGFFMKLKGDVDAGIKQREDALWERFEKSLHDARDTINANVGRADAHAIQQYGALRSEITEIKADLRDAREAVRLASILQERLSGFEEIARLNWENINKTLSRLEQHYDSAA